jgi:hypothetical protein
MPGQERKKVLLLKSYTPGKESGFDTLFKDEYAIIFLQGKNGQGEVTYCYVKVDYPNIKRFSEAVRSGKNFNPSDFGTVLAAGKGKPSQEVIDKLRKEWPMADKPTDLKLNK